MQIQLRKAVKEDCAAMMHLIKQLAVFEKEPDAVKASLEHFTECGFGKNPVWEAFVATDKDIIVGMAIFYYRYSTWRGKRLYLEDLYVDEAYRNHQIGKKLFETLQDYSTTTGCTGMNWQVLDWNENAIRFYKNFKDIHIEHGWLNGHWK